MELRERNYRSRFGNRSYKSKREAAEDAPSRPATDRERFSVTRNARQQQRLDPFFIVRKWLPWVIAAAVAYWAISTFVF